MFIARSPAPPLDAFVSVLWHATSPRSAGFEWVLPSGRSQLVVQLAERPNCWTDGHRRPHTAGSAVIGGPFVEPLGLDVADRRAVAGALFQPGGLAALLDRPIRDLAGSYADVADVLGPDAERLLDTVWRARTAEAQLDGLEAWLRQWIHRRTRRSALIRACVALADGRPVAGVAAMLGSSQRRFSRTFTDETGLTPKQFTRLSRLQRALSQMRREGAGDLAALALRCGYYDQAHLNHELRALANLTPSAYLAHAGPFTNHVQVSTSEGPNEE